MGAPWGPALLGRPDITTDKTNNDHELSKNDVRAPDAIIRRALFFK